MNKIVKTFQYGQQEVRLETGAVARQAHGAVVTSMGDTVVMVTVVGRKEGSGRDFLPLTVDSKSEPMPPVKYLADFLSVKDGHLKAPSLPADS